jgi:hypothetical protein
MKVAFVSNNKKQTSEMLLFLLASFSYLDLDEYSVTLLVLYSLICNYRVYVLVSLYIYF